MYPFIAEMPRTSDLHCSPRIQLPSPEQSPPLSPLIHHRDADASGSSWEGYDGSMGAAEGPRDATQKPQQLLRQQLADSAAVGERQSHVVPASSLEQPHSNAVVVAVFVNQSDAAALTSATHPAAIDPSTFDDSPWGWALPVSDAAVQSAPSVTDSRLRSHPHDSRGRSNDVHHALSSRRLVYATPAFALKYAFVMCMRSCVLGRLCV